MVEMSDAMRQQEKWIEENLPRKPKRTRDKGFSFQPWHVLVGLGAALALLVVIGGIMYR